MVLLEGQWTQFAPKSSHIRMSRAWLESSRAIANCCSAAWRLNPVEQKHPYENLIKQFIHPKLSPLEELRSKRRGAPLPAGRGRASLGVAHGSPWVMGDQNPNVPWFGLRIGSPPPLFGPHRLKERSHNFCPAVRQLVKHQEGSAAVPQGSVPSQCRCPTNRYYPFSLNYLSSVDLE